MASAEAGGGSTRALDLRVTEIPTLDSLSGVRYEFDISEKALVALGSEHGAAGLENAIRSQVLKHGGVVQH
jgi:hypothetical protein